MFQLPLVKARLVGVVPTCVALSVSVTLALGCLVSTAV